MSYTNATPQGVFDLTEEEIAEKQAQETATISEEPNRVREKRNALLAESDWTQITDATVDKTAWATYRTSLRDITTHSNFPDLEEADWPTKPEV